MTRAEYREIAALIIGMYDAPPSGRDLNKIKEVYQNGASLQDIARDLAASPEFAQAFANLTSPEERAAAFVERMLGANVPAGVKVWAIDWILARLAAGDSPADIILDAVQALRSSTNPALAPAQEALNDNVEALTTAADRSDILSLFIGMFNAAPGAVSLSALEQHYKNGASLLDIAKLLQASPEFAQSFGRGATHKEQAEYFVEQLLGDEAPAEAKVWAAGWVLARLTAGDSPAEIILDAVRDLRNTTSPAYANVQEVLINKMVVAEYYSVQQALSAADLIDIQAVLLGVTSDEASVAAAKAVIDTAINPPVPDPVEPAPAAHTFTLTAGADTIVGSEGDDEITGTVPDSLGLSDSIDGGAGADTLTVVSSVPFDTAYSSPLNIGNIEIIDITVTGGIRTNLSDTDAETLIVSNGGSGDINITAASTTMVEAYNSAPGGDVTLSGGAEQRVQSQGGALTLTGAVGEIAVTNQFVGAGTATSGIISISGGTTVSARSLATNSDLNGTTVTQGAVVVNGTASTTSVTVRQSATVAAVNGSVAGVAAGDVTITDANAGTLFDSTITTVSLTNFNNANVASNALADVTLTGQGAKFAMDAITPASAKGDILSLNLHEATIGDVQVLSDYKTLNISSESDASAIASLSATGATAMNISGDMALTLGVINLNSAAVIKNNGTGAVTITGALGAGRTYTGGDGVDTIRLSGVGSKAITTGAGNDVVTYAGKFASGGSVNGGEGTDTIIMTAAQAITATTLGHFGPIDGFEVLQLSSAAGASTINMAKANGINHLVTVGVTGVLAITNAAADFTLTQTALNTSAVGVAFLDSTGDSDTINLGLKGTNGYTNTGVTTIAGVENLVITTDTSTATAAFTVPLVVSAVETITVSGNTGVNFGTLDTTTLLSFDASDVTGSGVGGAITLITGDMSNGTTLVGGAGDDVFNASAATQMVFITGGAGADQLTGGQVRDIFVYDNSTESNYEHMDTITNLTVGTSGDTINLKFILTGATGVSGGKLIADMIDTSGAATLEDALNLASRGSDGDQVSLTWFQYDDDTYLVADRSGDDSYNQDFDMVIKIAGVVDLLAGTGLSIGLGNIG